MTVIDPIEVIIKNIE